MLDNLVVGEGVDVIVEESDNLDFDSVVACVEIFVRDNELAFSVPDGATIVAVDPQLGDVVGLKTEEVSPKHRVGLQRVEGDNGGVGDSASKVAEIGLAEVTQRVDSHHGVPPLEGVVQMYLPVSWLGYGVDVDGLTPLPAAFLTKELAVGGAVVIVEDYNLHLAWCKRKDETTILVNIERSSTACITIV